MVRSHTRKKPTDSMIRSRARSMVSGQTVERVSAGDDELQLSNGPTFDPTEDGKEFREAGVVEIYRSPADEHYTDSLVFVVHKDKQPRVLKKLLSENWSPDDFDDSRMGDYFLYRMWWD